MGTDIQKIFGQRLRRLREDRELRQRELADRLDVSPVVISRYERGASTPTLENAQKLADALGVTLDYFVSEDTVPNLLNEKEMIQRWSALDDLAEADKDRILYVVDSLIREAKTRKAFSSLA